MPVFNKMVYNGTEYILGGGGNIGEPTNISALVTSNSSVDIKWIDNSLQALPPSTFQKSVLVRKVGSAPATPSDGTTVVIETVMNTYQSSAYTDTGLTEGTTYYYQVFSYSTDGGITYGTPVSAIPSSPWQPGVNTVAYFPLNGDANDYSSNQYTGIWTGTETYTTLSSGLKVAVFNGSSYITTDWTSTFSSPSFTIIYWYKRSRTSGYDWVLWKGIEGSGTRLHTGFYSDGQAVYAFWGDSNPNWYVTDTNWHFFALTYSGTDKICYLDSNTPVTISNNPYNGFQNALYIGKNNRDTFHGNVSNIIWEDKAWTAQEIADYYNQTKSNYGIS